MMTLITGFTCPPTIYFKFITKCDSFFITKCDKCYYKVRQVLQSATVHTFLLRARAKCFAWLAYKTKNIYNSYISAFFLGVKANLFCIDGL